MRKTARRHSGFTIIELCMALLVTALVMGAMAAFSMAMATSWKSSEQQQSISLQGAQVVARLTAEIRQGKLINTPRAGDLESPTSGAAVLVWKSDTNGDGKIQGAEVEMIIHDTASHELWIYPTGQGDSTTVWSWATFNGTTVFADFAIGRTHYRLGRDIYGAAFEAAGMSSTSRSPSLRFSLKFKTTDSFSGVRSLLQYGTATVRAPLPQPS